MRTNVLEIISTMGEGGAESLVKDYGLLIDRAQFDLRILTIYNVKNSTKINQLLEAGVVVDSILPGNSLLWKLFKWSLGFFYIPLYIRRFIAKNRIDAVHVHMNQLHHLVPIMGDLRGVKVFYTVHNDPDVYFSKSLMDQEYKAVIKFKQKDNFTLISLHETMANQLSKMFNFDRIVTIRNGVDFEKFCSVTQTKEEIREMNGIPVNSFVIGHVGRFTDQKNHAFIVDMFEEILKLRPNSFLLLIGSGPLKSQIIEKLKLLNIEGKYTVFSYRQDIPELLKAMDVFILPSLFEGLPVSLVEAQVAKLPCVVSENINKESILLPSTKLMSLKASLTDWADTVLNVPNNVEWNDHIRKFDMRKEIKELESLYKG